MEIKNDQERATLMYVSERQKFTGYVIKTQRSYLDYKVKTAQFNAVYEEAEKFTREMDKRKIHYEEVILFILGSVVGRWKKGEL